VSVAPWALLASLAWTMSSLSPTMQKAIIAAGAAVVIFVAHYKRRATLRERFAKLRAMVDGDDRMFFEDEKHQNGSEHHPSTPAVRSSKPSVEKLIATKGYNATLVAERKKIYEAIKDVPRLAELDYQPSARFNEAAKEDVLHPLIEQASVILVPGAYFGDEGKGKTVDAIARHPAVKVVARVNSGENAGHTVISDAGHKYDFHLCPSGLLTPGKVNVIGPECVMDPVSFMQREVQQLIDTSVSYKDRLFIGNVFLVCPHHKVLDLIRSWRAPNTSTLQGMAPVHASKAARRGLRLDHLFNQREGSQGACARLETDLADYYGALAHQGLSEATLLDLARSNEKVQPHVLAFIEAKDKVQYTLDLFDRYVVTNADFPPRADVSYLLQKTIDEGGKVLLEGPQAYFLSNCAETFWDSGTSANTCASGMLCASRINLASAKLKPLVINIHKAPGSSRVGSGANPCSFVPQHYFAKTGSTKEDFEKMMLDWRDVSTRYFASIQPNGTLAPGLYTNPTGTYDLGVAMSAATCIHPSHREFGVTSGRPRVVGFFDLVAQAAVMQAQGPYCSISAFDRGDDYDSFAVCIAYVFAHPEGAGHCMCSNGRTFENGTIIRAGEQLPTQQILYHCHPIVKPVKGWRETPIFARSSWWQAQKHPIQLPNAVCDLLDVIEHFTGTQVISIGNGPRGEEIIYIERSHGSRRASKNTMWS